MQTFFSCRTHQWIPHFLSALLALLVLSISAGYAQDMETAAPQPDTAAAAPAQSTEDRAKIEFNKGVELFQIGQIQSEKGNRAGQKKLLMEAIHRFEAALKESPQLVEAQSNIGFAWLTLRDNRKAIAAFEKALLINPQHLNTLNGLATAYAFDNKLDKALATFDKLTTLNPANSQYFFNKGSVLQKAGRIDEAQAAYEQALKVQPTDQRSLFNMGTLLENQGKLEEARGYYEKAKGVEIGNTIGLEAIRRLEAINASLGKRP